VHNGLANPSDTAPSEGLADVEKQDVMDKFEKLSTLSHLKVDWDIVKGISIQQSLRSCGKLWIRSSKDLDTLAGEAIWHESQHVKDFDVFLSHTWKTSGALKVLSLSLQYGHHVILSFWVCGVLTAFLLAALGLLPVLDFQIEVNYAGCFKGTCRVGPWIMLAGPLSCLLGLLAFPYLPQIRGRPPVCFLDVASIHQTDGKLMERGIYGIGGFLSLTRDLRVLWSPPYLSRLWCVFELAAYRRANPSGKITLAPMFVEVASCMLMLMQLFAHLIWWICGRSPKWLWLAVAFAPCLPAIHLLRHTYRTKRQLFSDLEKFDLTLVQCSSTFDKEFIHGAIIQWYGSKEAFTMFVRGPLRKELLSALVSGPVLPYPWLVVTPNVTSQLTGLAGAYNCGAPLCGLVARAVANLLGGNLHFVVSFRLMLYLCERFAARRGGRVRDFGQSLLIFVAFSVFGYMGAVITSRLTAVRSAVMWALWTLLCERLSARYLKPPSFQGVA